MSLIQLIKEVDEKSDIGIMAVDFEPDLIKRWKGVIIIEILYMYSKGIT